ncbi:MAG: hypothetical protein ACI8PZ_000874 [Myxococcota bacterium]|jgi:hypothetical protein
MRTLLTAALLLAPAIAIAGEPVMSGPWKVKPFIRPALGATVFSDGVSTYTGVNLGAQGGINYFQERKPKELMFSGTSRIAGTYMLGSNSTGYDVRFGNFFGPKYSIIGVRTGPDIFQNQYTFDTVALPSTLGMDWPLIATLYLGPVDIYGGMQPTVFFSGNRAKVDWKAESAFGFGHEYTWLAGLSIEAGPVGISLGYTRRITAYGPQQGFGIGLRL